MTRGVLVSTKASHLRHLLRMAIGQEEIGRRIATAREEAGLSQRELAEKIGVADAQSVSRYERGITEVKTKRLEKIADATDKPLSFFVQLAPGEEDEPDDTTQVLAEIQSLRAMLETVLGRIDGLEEELRSRGALPEASQEPV